MIQYKLLTPGPLTTSESVKREMLVDHCTWDQDYNDITQQIRADLLSLAGVGPDAYTAVLMQGSGTFGVESVLCSSVGKERKLLILTNGAYGARMVEIAAQAGLAHCVITCPDHESPQATQVATALSADPSITHVAMVHCETTSGILNEIAPIAKVVKEAGRLFILDAMSSFGGIPIDMGALGIDFLISSANKCIQGVPGFSFILCRKSALLACEGCSHSLSLDLFAQWQEMDKNGKWRFTSPTHVVLAFAQALKELYAEGGVEARHARYRTNNEALIAGLSAVGLRPYLESALQSPIITSFYEPTLADYSFAEMYAYIKERGYAIYPGKVSRAPTFRIGNIGEIDSTDMQKLCSIFASYFESKRVKGESA